MFDVIITILIIFLCSCYLAYKCYLSWTGQSSCDGCGGGCSGAGDPTKMIVDCRDVKKNKIGKDD